jgi:XTP/dITP diphosphohydrolase
MPTLLIATGNPGKVREINALLEGLNIALVTPKQLGLKQEVEETGNTYAENATIKAVAFARAARLIALADDSGLEVDALAGSPGVRSARYSPKPGATDADRRAYLLERLQTYPPPWKAHFHCTVALASPSGEVLYAEGDCFGEIINQERGSNGFGYDPIFFIPELDKTMAELTMGEKNRLSHRARAIKSAIPILTEMLSAFRPDL